MVLLFVVCLQVFDNGKGYISIQDLRSIMTTLGDRMTHAEVDEMLSEAEIKNGYIKISGALALCLIVLKLLPNDKF